MDYTRVLSQEMDAIRTSCRLSVYWQSRVWTWLGISIDHEGTWRGHVTYFEQILTSMDMTVNGLQEDMLQTSRNLHNCAHVHESQQTYYKWTFLKARCRLWILTTMTMNRCENQKHTSVTTVNFRTTKDSPGGIQRGLHNTGCLLAPPLAPGSFNPHELHQSLCILRPQLFSIHVVL